MTADGPKLPPDPAQALRRSADGRAELRHRRGAGGRNRRRDRRRPRPRRPGRDRHRRRQHHPRPRRQPPRHRPRDRRLHGHAGHGDQRPGPPGRPGEAGRGHPGADGDRHPRGRRAVHPPAGDAPPREGADRHLRRRHRQPLLHHRQRRRPARQRDPRRDPAQGHQGRRHLLGRSTARRARRAAARVDLPAAARARPQDHGRGGGQPVPRQRHADRGVQPPRPPGASAAWCSARR